MNLKQIQELIKFVAKSGATEVDLEMGDVKICIKSPPKGKIVTDLNSPPLINTVPLAQAAPAQAAPAQAAPVPVSQEQSSTVVDNKSPVVDESHITIKSPIIGTFYRRPSPDKEPFINVGDKIDAGSVVGIVEAMKL